MSDTLDGKTYEWMGSEITLGSMWACRTQPTCELFPSTQEAQIPQMLAFLDIGTPLTLWDWVLGFIEETGVSTSEIPGASAYSDRLGFFFNDEGLFATTSRTWETTLGIPYCNEETYLNYSEYDYKFVIWVCVRGNSLYCLGDGGCGFHFIADERYTGGLISLQNRNLNYHGCTTWPNLTADDKAASSYFMFRLQQTYLPDATNVLLYYPPNGVPSTHICGFMNGIINHDANGDMANDLTSSMTTCSGVYAGGHEMVQLDPHDYNPNISPEYGDLLMYAPYYATAGVVSPDMDYTVWYGYRDTWYGAWNGWGDPSTFPPLTLISTWEDDVTPDSPVGGGGAGPIGITGNPQNRNRIKIPTLGPSDSGFTHLYAPIKSQLLNLTEYLWSSNFWDDLKKMFNDPMDSLISLNILPLNLSDLRGTAEVITIGNVQLPQIVMYPLTQDYAYYSFGDLPLTEIYQTALDYSPYSKFSVFLPFIGYVDVDPNDVLYPMGYGSIGVDYMVNLFTGDCIAYLLGKGTWNNITIIGTYTGNCAFQIPFSSSNYSNVYKNVISGVASTALAASTGGIGAAAGVNVMNSAMATAAGNVQIQRSGALTGGSSIMNYMYPHVLRTVPNKSIPANYGKILGYASNKYLQFKKCDGFTVVEELNMKGFTGNEAEAEELKSLLKSGVYFGTGK